MPYLFHKTGVRYDRVKLSNLTQKYVRYKQVFVITVFMSNQVSMYIWKKTGQEKVQLLIDFLEIWTESIGTNSNNMWHSLMCMQMSHGNEVTWQYWSSLTSFSTFFYWILIQIEGLIIKASKSL